MRVSYFMLARYAEFTSADGQVTIIGGDYPELTVPGVPAPVPSLWIVSKVMAPVEEAGKENSFRISILGPDEEVIHEGFSGMLAPAQLPPDRKIKEAGYCLILVANAVIFPKEGKYKVTLAIDGEEIATAPLKITIREVAARVSEETAQSSSDAEKVAVSGLQKEKENS